MFKNVLVSMKTNEKSQLGQINAKSSSLMVKIQHLLDQKHNNIVENEFDKVAPKQHSEQEVAGYRPENKSNI